MMEKTLPQKDAKLMEKRMFRLYDANNDGSIDFTELMVSLMHTFLLFYSIFLFLFRQFTTSWQRVAQRKS